MAAFWKDVKFIICILTSEILILCFFSLIPFGTSASLYAPDDPLWELDISNFNRIVHRKSNAWIIEFYNSWCGHCVRFAPTWKQFSRDIKDWKNVIDVAAVNCAESINVGLCREYGVDSYPTIKLFQANITEQNKGIELSGDRDVDSMRHTVISFLESQKSSGISSTWPYLQPLEIISMKELWSQLPETVNVAVLIIENPESFVGREIILDLSFRKHLVIRRILSTNLPFLNELKDQYVNSSRVPILIRVQRNGAERVLYRFPSGVKGNIARNKIVEILAGHLHNTDYKTVSLESVKEVKSTVPSGVYMEDLENAIHYAFKQEIGVHKEFSGPKLQALKSFLSIIKLYFPGSPTFMGYLKKLNNWVAHKRDSIDGEELVKAMNDFQTDKENLPEMHEWVGCKGSDPRYRGYPCSLWTLFHTLTVQAYNNYEENPLYTKGDPRRVLFAIRQYVQYFFTCKECSTHFQQVAEHMEKELHSPQDTVFWLWKAHNKVNKRLSGDITEDPYHPKVQFPPPELCSKCQIDHGDSNQDTLWDMNAVLRFLQYFYTKEHFLELNAEKWKRNAVPDQSEKVKHNLQTFLPNMQNKEIEDIPKIIIFNNSSYFEKWSFRWFTSTDISLCISLYMVSALLLVVIYFLFTQKRKRRKAQFAKFIKLYP